MAYKHTPTQYEVRRCKESGALAQVFARTESMEVAQIIFARKHNEYRCWNHFTGGTVGFIKLIAIDSDGGHATLKTGYIVP